VAGNFGVGWSLAKRGNKEFRPSVHEYGFQSMKNPKL
jgi:hypothetical protein